MQLQVKRLTDTAKLPVKAHLTDAGFDMFSDEDVTIKNKTVAVSTGLSIAIEQGYYARLKARSGLTLKTPLRVLEGTIDADYRGEVKVICDVKSNQSYEIKKGDKIAQLIIQPLPPVDLVEVKKLEDTKRGNGGFGSTGL
ncbi:dUTP diphosphatase [Vagococcus entomophilus]|uniref:dUTP diphosphatase n=1 Tax=Vagococcus entomophilus TaxID=1160095 RepID=A0A430AK13_9ENTE|nr:dUTP diphosphatase [Vagococcus entomophilus]RSU08446.1 hypothetical protein CBF30_04190 [Vagococcus entomophilus]